MRKTDKYFRTELRKGFDEGLAVIADVLKKHFTGKWRTEVKVENEFNWNHCVEGFGLTSKGEVYVNIYWQGDNTDGNNTVCLNDFRYRNEVVIPAESFFDGYRTRNTHGDIHVEKFEIIEAFKRVADYLEPAAIKARKAKNN